MRRSSTLLAAAAGAVALAVPAPGIASGAFDDDDGTESPVSGTALERASEAALAETGEGRVTDIELGDEEGFYEVEATPDNGDEVDVYLTEDFQVIGTESDAGGSSDD